jgi:hypothetical protein
MSSPLRLVRIAGLEHIPMKWKQRASIPQTVITGHSRPKDGVASAHLCPGDPRLYGNSASKTSMAGSSPATTKKRVILQL